MDLEKGLEILVKDWEELHEDGGTKFSVGAVLTKLNIAGEKAVNEKMKPGQIAELIMDRLRQMPGALQNTEKFMAQFESSEDLLDEFDLDCLVSDLSMEEDDDLQSEEDEE